MQNFIRNEHRAWGLGGKESEVFGKVKLDREHFTPFLICCQEIINNFNLVELTNSKGREGGDVLISKDESQSRTGEHELFYFVGDKCDVDTKENLKITRSITTPFLRFEGNSIVQKSVFHGSSSKSDIFTFEGITPIEVRLGLEFFGASQFSKFFNFAPSVVATIHTELTSEYFALRLWREEGRVIFENERYGYTLQKIDAFCRQCCNEGIL